MSFRTETIAFHQQRIRELQNDIEHLERVVATHTAVADDKNQDPAERDYARMSAARSQKALDQKREILSEFQRGAAMFSIATREEPDTEGIY